MKKNYINPMITVTVVYRQPLMFTVVGSSDDGDAPGAGGGTDNGTHTPGSRRNSLWDDD